MYFRAVFRTNPLTGKSEPYYRLAESYRNEAGRPCQNTLLAVGYTELKAEQLNLIQHVLNARAEGKGELFATDDPLVTKHIEYFWEQLIAKKKVDTPAAALAKRKKLLYEDTLRHKNVKEIGAEWMCLNTLNLLQLKEFFESLGWEDEQIRLTYTQLISRAVHPASELKTARWIKENSAVCELTQYPAEKITKDKLYKNALRLWKNKQGIESYLSKKTNELFDIEDKIILYDLTNTYFEGKQRDSGLAQHGHSKEKRNDCKIIVLAMVINPEGFIKYTNVFEGRTGDASTLGSIVEHLRVRTSETATRATVVLDAGIASEANLQLLQEKGYDYVCVRRCNLKEYKAVLGSAPQIINTRNKERLSVQRVSSPSSSDYMLQVKSSGKVLKESSMKSAFEARYEKAMENIKLGMSKKHGVKQADKVNRRIGRVQEKYPSAAKYYEVEMKADEKGNVIELRYEKNPEKYAAACEDLGVYFLRTNKPMKDEQTLWNTYNLIREIEGAFRTLKTDLDLRPVYHKRDEATLAHLHLGLLAYWLVNTIRHQLKRQGITSCWSELVRIANTQKAVVTEAQNALDEQVSVRRCSEPVEKLAAIYKALNIRPHPFVKRKSVVLKPASKKIENQCLQGFSPP